MTRKTANYYNLHVEVFRKQNKAKQNKQRCSTRVSPPARFRTGRGEVCRESGDLLLVPLLSALQISPRRLALLNNEELLAGYVKHQESL